MIGVVGAAAGAAIRGAASGAVVGGGVPGAVAGAAKGAVAALTTDRRVHRALLALCAFVVLAGFASAIVLGVLASSVFASISGGRDANSSIAATSSGAEQVEITSAVAASEATGLPWHLHLALSRQEPDFSAQDYAALVEALDIIDPDELHRELTAGALYFDGDVALSIPEADSDVPDAAALRAAADEVQNTYVDALQSVGLSEAAATRAYLQARRWALGEERCTTNVPDDSEPREFAGATLQPNQIRHARVVIGVAKTMFAGDAERAAGIAALTAVHARTGLQVYANDGVIGTEDGETSDASAAEYEAISASLDQPHDLVGTDRLNLGLLLADVAWGEVDGSTFGQDSDAVVARAMDGAYAIGRFNLTISATAGWESAEPASLAEAVMGSGPDYAGSVDFATAAWDELAADSLEVTVPTAVGWVSGDEQEADTSCGRLVSGTWVWPVETRADGTPLGYLSSEYGWRNTSVLGGRNFHKGIDFAGFPTGAPIFAVGGGVVVTAITTSDNCQDYVRVEHADGTSTGYLHLNSRSVTQGEVVAPGDQIGTMGGQRGCSTGTHLHLYACDSSLAAMNPVPYLEERGLVLPEGYNRSTPNGGQDSPARCRR